MNEIKRYSERNFYKDADGIRTHRTITDEDTNNGPVVTIDDGITDYRENHPSFSNRRIPRERNNRKEAEEYFGEQCEATVKADFRELADGEAWPVV